MRELQSIRRRKQQRHNWDGVRLLPGRITLSPGGSLLPVVVHMRKWSGGPFLSGKMCKGMLYWSLMRQKANKS